MKLQEVLNNSVALDGCDVVYARRPWSLESAACVVRYQANESVLSRLGEDASFEYFLEAALIRDIQGRLADAGKASLEVLNIILYYAENDAFP